MPDASTRDPRANPFGSGDPERRAIWEMLVARDSIAFAKRDWRAVADDFEPERFEGIHAHESNNPDHWTIQYPTLESYRDDWLRSGGEFRALRLREGTHEDLLFRLSRLEEIEIAGDRALCHKKFQLDETLADGTRMKVSKQTLYRLHRIGGRWKIVGFVGYLPL